MEKKIIMLFLFLVTASLDYAQEIKFYEGSFEEAKEEAKKENKLLFIDVYADWCKPCKMLSEQIFTLKNVSTYFNNKFINFRMNADLAIYASFLKENKIQGLPTLLFIDNNGNIVNRTIGMLNSYSLLRSAKIALKLQKTEDELYAMYRKDKDNFDIQKEILLESSYFMRKYQGDKQKRWVFRIEKIYNNYISKKGLEQMINRDDFNILMMFHNRMEENDKVVDFIMDNFDKFVSVVDSNLIAKYITALHSNYVIEMARKGDKKYLSLLEKMTDKFLPAYKILFADPIKYQKIYTLISDANYAIFYDKNFCLYAKYMDEFLKIHGNPQVNDYVMIIQTLFNATKGKLSKVGYKKSIEWIELATKVNANIETKAGLMMTKGDCFRGLDNKKEAEICYNQACALLLKSKNQRFISQMLQVIKQKLSIVNS